MRRNRGEWLGETLYSFGGDNLWTVRDAVEGTQVFGATGSGKSSGSGRALAVSMLRKGFGGLVLTAKSDDLDTWIDYFREAAADPSFDPNYKGKPEDYDARKAGKLVVIDAGGSVRFNPFEYEWRLARGDAAATQGSRLVSTIVQSLGRDQRQNGSNDAFWEESLRTLLGHAVDLYRFANGAVVDGAFVSPVAAPSLQTLQDIIRSAPQSLDEAASERWQQCSAECPSHLREAYLRCVALRAAESGKNAECLAEMANTFDYFLSEFAGLAEKTRSVVVSSFTSKVSGLLRAPLSALLCSDGDQVCHPDATPEATYDGMVVLVNLPVKTFGEVGAFAQRLIKTVWQHATESSLRDVDGPCLPVFLWADESQFFVTDEDVLYQATARSKLAATVYLTQNIAGYYSQLGGQSNGKTDALLGSLQMKVLHTNGDPQTNEWAERLFGQEESCEPQLTENTPHSGPGGNTSRTHVYRRVPFVNAYEFSQLIRGGGEAGRAEAYVFFAGKRWTRCDLRDEALPKKRITQVASGRGVKHLFLQSGDRVA